MGQAGLRSILAAAATAALLLAGCSSESDEELRDGMDTTLPSESSAASPTVTDDDKESPDKPSSSGDAVAETGDDMPFPANMGPDTADPTGENDTYQSVTNIRTAEHQGYDRVVFDVDGQGSGTPGWRVEYVGQAQDDGSGKSVEVDGDAILRVSLAGMATPRDSGVDEFARDRIEPEDAEAVEEIVYRSWFEGFTTTFIGVDDGERPFRVFLLEDPTRVVVDIQH